MRLFLREESVRGPNPAGDVRLGQEMVRSGTSGPYGTSPQGMGRRWGRVPWPRAGRLTPNESRSPRGHGTPHGLAMPPAHSRHRATSRLYPPTHRFLLDRTESVGDIRPPYLLPATCYELNQRRRRLKTPNAASTITERPVGSGS